MAGGRCGSSALKFERVGFAGQDGGRDGRFRVPSARTTRRLTHGLLASQRCDARHATRLPSLEASVATYLQLSHWNTFLVPPRSSFKLLPNGLRTSSRNRSLSRSSGNVETTTRRKPPQYEPKDSRVLKTREDTTLPNRHFILLPRAARAARYQQRWVRACHGFRVSCGQKRR